jgi:chromosome partitioning protein
VAGNPFVLAIGSHKGGTGRTTAACALAWLWGRDGFRVLLADADPAQAAGKIALDDTGTCSWANVAYWSAASESTLSERLSGSDIDMAIVDCPPFRSPAVQESLQRAHGVVLTCLADPLSLRTVPAAAEVIGTARVGNPELELMGLLVGIYSETKFVQEPMLERLRRMHGETLIEPPIPYDAALRDWPLTPGADLSSGPAAVAYAWIRRRLAELAWRLHGAELGVAPLAGRT